MQMAQFKRKKIKKQRNIKINSDETRKFFKNLNKFGYIKISGPNIKIKSILLVKAFQRRFRQSLINGNLDKECFLISKNLLKNQNIKLENFLIQL